MGIDAMMRFQLRVAVNGAYPCTCGHRMDAHWPDYACHHGDGCGCSMYEAAPPPPSAMGAITNAEHPPVITNTGHPCKCGHPMGEHSPWQHDACRRWDCLCNAYDPIP